MDTYYVWVQTNKGKFYLGHVGCGYEFLMDNKEKASKFYDKKWSIKDTKDWIDPSLVFAIGTEHTEGQDTMDFVDYAGGEYYG